MQIGSYVKIEKVSSSKSYAVDIFYRFASVG